MEGREGLGRMEKGGEEVNRSRSGKHARRDISLLAGLERLPTPSSLPSLYFLFRFSSGRISCQILIWKRKSSQDEAVNVFVSRLAGHRCQLASGEPDTPLDQVVRSPFSSSSRKYSTYFFTLSSYFIKPSLYPISCHVITFVSLPWPLSVPELGIKCFTFHTNRAAAL